MYQKFNSVCLAPVNLVVNSLLSENQGNEMKTVARFISFLGVATQPPLGTRAPYTGNDSVSFYFTMMLCF